MNDGPLFVRRVHQRSEEAMMSALLPTIGSLAILASIAARLNGSLHREARAAGRAHWKMLLARWHWRR
ncbi:hypothetical protein [Caballeronia arationis]|jgi:hypothetical protein|nr:hypothetical protein [Caballeronia arationis]